MNTYRMAASGLHLLQISEAVVSHKCKTFCSTHFLKSCYQKFLPPVRNQFLFAGKMNFSNASQNMLTSKSHNTEPCMDDEESEINELSDVNLDFNKMHKPNTQEWEEIISSMKVTRKEVNAENCDGIIMKKCMSSPQSYLMASSYLEYIHAMGRTPNMLTSALYLEICGRCVNQCGEEEVLRTYENFIKRFSLLDVNCSEIVAIALCSTSKWKESFKYLKVIQALCSISVRLYSAIIAAAFRCGEWDIAWKYFDMAYLENRQLQEYIYLDYLYFCQKLEDKEEKEKLVKVLVEKLGTYEILPNEEVISLLSKVCQEDLLWASTTVRIGRRGQCPACSEQLKLSSVDSEKFSELKEIFASRILHGSDIFRSTSPKEWAAFEDFVLKNGPFSAVVDGLNVSYITGQKPSYVKANILRLVVEEVAKRHGGKVLVIGRSHMNSWSRQEMTAINRIAHLYMLDNMTKDDGFFLYAALQSNVGTVFVTSDFLRDHTFRLQDVHLRETFLRWQRAHQIHIESTPAGIRLIEPQEFCQCAQESSNMLHVPFNDGKTEVTVFNPPTSWLCIQTKEGVLDFEKARQSLAQPEPKAVYTLIKLAKEKYNTFKGQNTSKFNKPDRPIRAKDKPILQGDKKNRKGKSIKKLPIDYRDLL
ncbi:mitochondrial ribonuclease P catalytic subunit isoform X2 [Oratosquilla oratoria]